MASYEENEEAADSPEGGDSRGRLAGLRPRERLRAPE